MTDQTIYISGPMTGVKDFNREAFLTAEEGLICCYTKVINPAKNHEGRTDLKWEDYMKVALPQVVEADVIYLLKGWYKSRGARLEFLVATELGKEFIEGCI